jgi:Protein of unknown function (DUF2723)
MPRTAQGAAWVAALAALWVYVLTLSPTVTWRNFGEDSGDLLVASATLGIPHPTGYPLYTLLGRVLSLVPFGNEAFRINLVSALAGAASVLLLALWVQELVPLCGAGAGAFGALSASLLYAFSRGAWSQSVLAEVYSLNAAFLASILWLNARADRTGEVRPLVLAGYLFGLGLTNHLLVLAAAPALAFSIGRRVLRRTIGPFPLVLLLLLTLWGVTLDLYLPIRAGRGPEFSWGVPNTPERLAWVLTGAQYAGNFFRRGFPDAVRHLVPGRWVVDFGLGLIVLLAGLALALVSAARSRLKGAGPAILAMATAIVLLSLYSIPDDVGYWMPVALVASGLSGAGLATLWDRARSKVPRAGLAALGTAVLVLAVARSYREVDASNDLTPYLYARKSIESVEPNAVIVSDYDGRTFALWFYKATEFRRSHPDLVVAYKALLVWPWYRGHIAKRYPDLSVPSGPPDANLLLNRIIARNIRHRPVYLVRDDPALAPIFRTEPVGLPSMPIFRVRLRSA